MPDRAEQVARIQQQIVEGDLRMSALRQASHRILATALAQATWPSGNQHSCPALPDRSS